MKFKIVHESRGRVRIQVMQKRMTLEQADLLEAYLNHSPAIRQAHDYMLANLGQPLTIEGLARRFHISGTFLKEGFRQMYGQSTRKFLQMRRMDKASELLRTTNQTVLQIAVAVGYESASQFSQIFKRHYQLPPAQYRRQIIKRNV